MQCWVVGASETQKYDHVWPLRAGAEPETGRIGWRVLPEDTPGTSRPECSIRCSAQTQQALPFLVQAPHLLLWSSMEYTGRDCQRRQPQLNTSGSRVLSSLGNHLERGGGAGGAQGR